MLTKSLTALATTTVLALAPSARGSTTATGDDDTPRAAAAGNIAQAPAARGTRPKPNVVFVMVDDMRNDELRYMPRTRRLIGGRGVRFTNSFAPYSLCCPARASTLTGQYAHNHKVWSHQEPYGFQSFNDRNTLPVWLQNAGYHNTYIGKYLNGYGPQQPHDRSMPKSVRYVPPGWDDWRASIDGGLRPGHPKVGGTYRFMDTTLADNGRGFTNYAGTHQTDAYGTLAANVITRRARSDSPFFLYVSYTAPHFGGPHEKDDPGNVTDPDGTEYRLGSPHVAARFRDTMNSRITDAPGADWHRATKPTDKPAYLSYYASDYAGLTRSERAGIRELARQRAESIAHVDQSVARIMRTLKATGELSNTVVVFTSDNGFLLGEQGIRASKGVPHEPSLRTPLLLRGPSVPHGGHRTDPIMSIDLAPTLTHFARVPVNAQIDGRSLAPVARHGDRGWNRGVLVESGPGMVFPYDAMRDTDETGAPLGPDNPGAADVRYIIGVRTPRYLYTDLATGEEELYDLRVDPAEYDNLAGRPEYAAVLEQLRAQVRILRACDGPECAAPLPPGL